MNDLSDVIIGGPDTTPPVAARQAVVSDTSPVEVTLADGTGIPASYAASYTPTIGDVVACIQLGTDLFIIDKILSGG